MRHAPMKPSHIFIILKDQRNGIHSRLLLLGRVSEPSKPLLIRITESGLSKAKPGRSTLIRVGPEAAEGKSAHSCSV